MRVLVTGSSGFVGSHVCSMLVKSGHIVTRVGRRPSSEIDYVIDDLSANPDWTNALDNIQAVVHCAAQNHAMNANPQKLLSQYRTVNVNGTIKLAEQALQSGVQRFIYISSIKVNGESTIPGSTFTELDIPAPIDPYGISKWEAEQALMKITQNSKMESVIIRPPLIYGPGVKGNFEILMKIARSGLPIPLGNVKNRRSFLAIENLNDFIHLCIDKEKSPSAANQTFIICDNATLSTPDLIKKISNAYGIKSNIFKFPTSLLALIGSLFKRPDLSGRIMSSLALSNLKANEILGWTPPIDMDLQLKMMLKK